MGGYHHDTDSNTTYRLAKSLTDDYYIGKDTNGDWFATLGVGQPPIPITDAMMMAGIHFFGVRERQRLTAQVQAQQTVINTMQQNPPAPAGIPQARQQTRHHTPQVFTGQPDDKGVYDPTPRDFTRTMWNYIDACEKANNNTLMGEGMRVVTAGTYLAGPAAEWYELEVQKADAVATAGGTYTGPLRTFNAFRDALLKEFEDVDIKKTSQHKIAIIAMGTDAAEVHVRHFRYYARYTEFNDEALLIWFKRSLKQQLREKINGMNPRPDTLEAWYEAAITLDRQYREDQE